MINAIEFFKNKKIKRIFMVFTFLIFAICLVGCSEEGSIKEGNSMEYELKFCDSSFYNPNFQNFFNDNVKFSDKSTWPDDSKIVKTYEELILLCDENNISAFSENSMTYNSEVNKLIRSFTVEYFESKALIMCLGVCHLGLPLEEIKNVFIVDDRLVVNCELMKVPDDAHAIAAIIIKPWILIVEMNQKDLQNINQVQLLIE